MSEILSKERLRGIETWYRYGNTDQAGVINALIASHRALQAERDALKAQHENLVLRNRLLRDRPDLPIERLQAYDDLMKHWDALKAELAKERAQ